jgi:hypothetical protein
MVAQINTESKAIGCSRESCFENCSCEFLVVTKSMIMNKVRSTAHSAIYLQLDIIANALEIRAVQSPKCIVWCAVDCT